MPYVPSKPSEPKKRLLHIRDKIHLARKFVKGLDYEAFRDNDLIFYAVTRCFDVDHCGDARSLLRVRPTGHL